MKTAVSKLLGFAAFIFLISSISFGQVTSSNNQSTTPEINKAREVVNKILIDSGNSFKEGLRAYKENRRSDAGTQFDKSVETFLYSAINIQKDQKLQSCYSQLIETVYRIEFPANGQAPQVRPLTATCGWNWSADDLKLADQVVSMSKPAATTSAPSTAIATTASGNQPKEALVGFNEQQFEPLPLDDLSKLELTP